LGYVAGLPTHQAPPKAPEEPSDVAEARKTSRSHKERAEALLETLSEDDRKALVNDFLTSLPSSHPVCKAHAQSSEKAPMFRMAFYEWLVKQMPE